MYYLTIVPEFHSTIYSVSKALRQLSNRLQDLGVVSARHAIMLMLRASLVLVVGLGMGHSMLCSGHGFITVDDHGTIVSDVSESWEHDHCVPVSSPVTRLTRTWGNSRHPHLIVFLHSVQGNVYPAYADAISFNRARAPPLS